jgi:hypothetical protein
MTDWSLQIPFRNRDESLVDVASHCRTLEADDIAVSRTIVLDAAVRGMRTAGELIDHLDGLEPHERRAMLNQARGECNLPPTADVEASERAAFASKAGSVIAARYGGLTICHGKTSAGLRCNAVPLTSHGVPRQIMVAAWHCAEHIGQARPGDMDPLPSPWRYSPSGAIVENDPAEEARAAAEAESRRRRLESDLADRAVDAAELHASKQASDAAHRRELPPHLQRLVA